MTYLATGELQTRQIGFDFAKRLVAGDIVLFSGELGAGKTTMIRGLLEGLGFVEAVRSPTFNLIQTFDTNPPVMHADLYRLKSYAGIGIEDYLSTHLCLIEWPDRLAGLLDPSTCWRVDIDFSGDGGKSPSRVLQLPSNLKSMGRDAVCLVESGGTNVECKVHLDTDAVIFRGALKRVIPFGSIVKVQPVGERLELCTSDGAYLLDLGEKVSTAWTNAILNPPTLLSKLGVKEGMRILTLGFQDLTFLGPNPSVQKSEPGDRFDLVFVLAEAMDDLTDLESLAELLLPKGAIWTVSPKGNKSISELDVLMRGRAAGLVDTKVCRFSETHTGRRFVRPRG